MADGTSEGREEGPSDTKSSGIPLVRKISYAVGGMPYQLTQSVKGFFMQIFLLDVVQMDAFYASLILFMGRAWDAITDPIVGYMVSKSKRTRIGKLIPWIVFSLPFGIVSYIMMWFMPQDSMSPAFSFSWFFIWTCLFDLFLTCHHVPYSSLNMFLGGDQNARDSATGYRMGMEVFAVLAGGVIQSQIVGVHHAKKTRVCSQLNYSDTSSINLSYPALHNLTSSLTDTTAATLSIPLWQILLCRLGKKTTLYIGLSMFAPAMAAIVYAGNSLPIFIFMVIIGGFSLAVLFLLPWSMLPDVVDDFKLKNPSSKDLEPVFYSCFVFFNKFVGGLSIGLSTLVLHFVGYKPGACRHPPAVITALRVLIAPVPIVLLFTGILLFCLYPINEKRRQQIQRNLYKAVKDDAGVAMDTVSS
ncbi:sodium-dependent lysophosphatidylcholine symporter 1 isoform X5 [Centroberyx affinis]|uniref:sodium-dependent lysophosphatidylcholine symporter 1 isoform X5 n=1 Tax=Centroberyx affinis TaxID=166261 RepID=UPI003A5C588E